MFQNPVIQQQLARELDREKAAIWQNQQALPPTESVLDSVVRRLKQLIGTRPLQPLARGSA
jgi:hypothetical protein